MDMYVCMHVCMHGFLFRGLPLMGRDKQMIWQYLRTLAGVPVTMTGKPTAEMKKKTLVFASASTWGRVTDLLIIRSSSSSTFMSI